MLRIKTNQIKPIQNFERNDIMNKMIVAILALALTGSVAFAQGAGGAGRAICSVLSYYGAKKIYVSDYYEASARSLVADLNANFSPDVEYVPFEDFSKLPECGVVINATGVGMGSSVGKSPLPAELIRPDQFFFDACYNPAKTQFLLNAEAKGARILNGLGMSLYQGVAQIELWTGKEAPAEAMRRELLTILEENAKR